MKRLLPMLVALTLVAQVAQATHFVLVAHSVCAEHGELVHHTHDDEAHAVAYATPHDDDAPNAVAAAHSDDADEHDHCSALSEQRQRIVPERIETPRIAESTLPTPVITAHTTVVVRDCLDVAPKASPPAV